MGSFFNVESTGHVGHDVIDIRWWAVFSSVGNIYGVFVEDGRHTISAAALEAGHATLSL